MTPAPMISLPAHPPEHAPLGTCLVDAEERILWVNERFSAMVASSLPGGDLLGRPFRTILRHPNRLPPLASGLSGAGDVQEAFEEAELHACNGQRRWADLLVSAADASLAPQSTGAYAIALIPCTGRRMRRKQTVEQGRQDRFLLEALRAIPYQFNWSERRYTYIGPQAEKILGYPRESFLEQGFWSSILHPEDKDEVLRFVREESNRGMNREVDYRVVAADGRIVALRDVVNVGISAEEDVVLSGLMIDITGIRALEQEYHEAQKSEVVGRLVGGMAHELNNLFVPILLYAEEMMQDLPAEHPHQEKLREVITAVDRGTSLMRQLLSYARRDGAQGEVFDVNVHLQNATGTLVSRFGGEVALEFTHAPAPCWVRMSPAQLQQVVFNLVQNAAEASPCGSRVQVQTSLLAGPPASVLLTISDHGHGIPPSILPQIFKPYFTTKPGARGLGLSVAESIVRNARGTLRAESSPAGTILIVTLPLAENPTTQRPPESQRPPSGSNLPYKPVILLVEDEANVRAAIGGVLTSNGYRVIAVENGAGAEAVLERFPDPIHLLITDVYMSRENGVELARRLKQRRPDMKVLHISGSDKDSMAIEEGPSTGFHFLQKPFSIESMLRTVERLTAAPSP